ncbi:hypothetical protein UCDDA912_g00280 [Diaporthe ampelina]|uniref:Polyketide synthase extender module SpnB-like Rossmann fold domain-containing protein n=1 Tax=Diaporthe ampelina TaxID=1214573 RepID=A0A0G2FZV8_9PEZI|nr:hypothetical protein UCDDA912_g00280 [Diaporthe ampelina]
MVDISRAYQALADAGISYGPSFQCVRDLYRLEWNKSIQITQSGGKTETSLAVDTMENGIREAIASVLGVVQKWSAHKAYAGGRLVIVTEKATLDTDPDLVAAAVWGFVRSAQAEFSGGRIVLVDLDRSTESEAALTFTLASKEDVFAIRKGTPLIPRLSKVAISSNQVLISPETSASASTLDVSGTVLITGGTGGLGALLSRHIARAYGAKSLLLITAKSAHLSAP